MDSGKKLYRSLNNRIIAGVCGGLAQYFKIDPSIIRIICVATTLVGSLGFWCYILFWIFIPEENTNNQLDYCKNKQIES